MKMTALAYNNSAAALKDGIKQPHFYIIVVGTATMTRMRKGIAGTWYHAWAKSILCQHDSGA